MHSNKAARVPRASTATTVRRAVIVVVIVLALLYALHVLWLFMMASEGDVPPASAVPLPAGAEIVSESRDCASGGCWVMLEVEPPSGQSPEALAEEIGATPQLEIPGNVFDPRTVWVSAKPTHGVLTLTVNYWSQKWVP